MEIKVDDAVAKIPHPGNNYRYQRHAVSFRQIVSSLNQKYPSSERDASNTTGLAWVDHDDSGNYCPGLAGVKSKAGAQKTVHGSAETNTDDGDDGGGGVTHNEDPETKTPRSKISTYEHGRRTGKSKVVALKFTAEKKNQFKLLVSAHPEEDKRNGFESKICSLSEIKTRSHSGSSHDTSRSTKLETETRYEHLIGHPAARGCRECYDLGLDCPLIQNVQDYPCATCREDKTKCNLITPKERKGTCERCKQQKTQCSYNRDGGIYANACDNCARLRRLCIPGPANSRSFGSLSRSKKEKTSQGVESAAASHDQRSTKKQKSCQKLGLAETSHDPKGSEQTSPCHRKPSIMHINRKAVKKIVFTSYCHPIKFNWVPPSPHHDSFESQMHCHFCTDPGISYGLCGLGERSVRVADQFNTNFRGYEELGGGWADCQDNSRMCAPCTMERLLIMSCTKHKIRRIYGLNEREFDFDKPYLEILETLERREEKINKTVTGQDVEKPKAKETKWCSICIAPAFFECCARPGFDKFGRPGDDYNCGLLLCEICASRLKGGSVEDQKGDQVFTAALSLENLVAAAMNDSIHYEVGLRADVGFLTRGGELRRFVDADIRACYPATQSEKGDAKITKRARHHPAVA